MAGSVCSESSDADLIARVLGGGEPAADLSSLATRLAGLPHWERRALGVSGLMRALGVTAARAAQLTALWELIERHAPDDRPAVVSPRDALLLLDRLRTARREEVVVILLDARHRPLGVETVAVGTLNASRMQPRDVFGPALRGDAVAVIM